MIGTATTLGTSYGCSWLARWKICGSRLRRWSVRPFEWQVLDEAYHHGHHVRLERLALARRPGRVGGRPDQSLVSSGGIRIWLCCWSDWGRPFAVRRGSGRAWRGRRPARCMQTSEHGSTTVTSRPAEHSADPCATRGGHGVGRIAASATSYGGPVKRIGSGIPITGRPTTSPAI
jgi:hypothetical protein